ncbi:Hypotetical protein [Gulosibacter molinativorax]|nr:Hypotetical protein [Gulosibacter molinativorax]
MSFPALSAHRFVAQGLLPAEAATSPQEAAELLSCAQGQHLGGVIAALALRSGTTAAEVVDAFNAGALVRGYPMRGTVFAMSANDAGWLTSLGGPRSVQGATRRREELELSDARIAQLTEAILELLRDEPGGALTRNELGDRLAERGLPLTSPQRYHTLFTLIASGVLLYGPISGSEHLVVSAADWLPASGSLEARFNGDELAATAEWLRRYLMGHGPATLRDFSWWTKLPLGQIRKAKDAYLTESELEHYGLNGAREELWGPPGLTATVSATEAKLASPRLLPPFDELLLGYQDRSALVHDDHHSKIDVARNGVFKPVVYVKGRLVATWASVGSGKNRRLEVTPFERPLSQRAIAALAREFARYPHR